MGLLLGFRSAEPTRAASKLGINDLVRHRVTRRLGRVEVIYDGGRRFAVLWAGAERAEQHAGSVLELVERNGIVDHG
jgi:hypothetical protein